MLAEVWTNFSILFSVIEAYIVFTFGTVYAQFEISKMMVLSLPGSAPASWS